MSTNNFLPFCPTDTSTNLLTQGQYAAATDRDIGNQPGVASSKLVNKAMRQSSFIIAQVAQYIANQSNTDVLDDADDAKLLSQITGVLTPLSPLVSYFVSGSGTWNKSYTFIIETGSATAGATYTNNAVTFTVTDTVASATVVRMRGSGAPLTSGTLTKSGGTGDATLTFIMVRAPIYIKVTAIGGGGGGGGSSTIAANDGGAGGAGVDTTFGSSLITAGGGAAGSMNGSDTLGGGGSVNAPAVGALIRGGGGSGVSNLNSAGFMGGGAGGNTLLGGGGGAGQGNNSVLNAAAANTGGGGGGAGAPSLGYSGAGGSGGGFVAGALIYAPAATYVYAVGTGGAAGAAGTGGFNGGAGAPGIIIVEDYYN